VHAARSLCDLGAMNRRAWLVLMIAVVGVAAARLRADDGRSAGALAADQVRVTRVVDGDTIKVSIDGERDTVRYIGIDTPESRRPNTPVQCFAKEASAENARLVDGERVRLRFDVERRDRYGRLLAYVYRVDDGRFVNAELVGRGYARTLTIPPNVRFAERFAALQTQAREARRGLWSRC